MRGLVIMYAVERTLCCIALQHKYVHVSHVLALGTHMTDDGDLNHTVPSRMITTQKELSLYFSIFGVTPHFCKGPWWRRMGTACLVTTLVKLHQYVQTNLKQYHGI